MSRALNLKMSVAQATSRCRSEDVGISTLEPLLSGGVRLVCTSMAGADLMRSRYQTKVINGDVVRERHRPDGPSL